MVKAQKQKEVKWLHANEVCQKVQIIECWQMTGKLQMKLWWIDTNNGGDAKANYRSSKVVREVRRRI